jgi:zinc transporter 1/2/3
MSLLIYKTLAGIIIFITSVLTVAYPLKVRAYPTHHRLLELGDAFASGIFLGAALFHMLPDAITDFAAALRNTQYPLAEFFCASGFLLLLFFERLSDNTHEHHDHTHGTIPYVIATIIIIHSLIEGAVLGTYTTLASATIIFVAIIAHKGSESFALAVTLNRSNLSLRNTIILLLLFSLMTPLGIGLGTILSLSLQYKKTQLITAGFNAFAAGTFLYMSTLHHINHHQSVHKGEGLIEFFALLGGLFLMAGIAVWEVGV